MKSEIIKNSFQNVKKDILDLRDGQIKIVNSLNELNKKISEIGSRLSPRSSPRTIGKEEPRSIQKKFLIGLDNAKLISAINNLIEEGYNTTQIKEEIMFRFGIKKTCFFKYFKLVRERFAIKSAE